MVREEWCGIFLLVQEKRRPTFLVLQEATSHRRRHKSMYKATMCFRSLWGDLYNALALFLHSRGERKESLKATCMQEATQPEVLPRRDSFYAATKLLRRDNNTCSRTRKMTLQLQGDTSIFSSRALHMDATFTRRDRSIISPSRDMNCQRKTRLVCFLDVTHSCRK